MTMPPIATPSPNGGHEPSAAQTHEGPIDEADDRVRQKVRRVALLGAALRCG